MCPLPICLSKNLPFWMSKSCVDFIQLDNGLWKQRQICVYIIYNAVNDALNLTTKN